jgi:signal transduction histidine kinase
MTVPKIVAGPARVRSLISKTAEKSLRSLMYRRIVIWTLVCGVVAAVCVYGAAELLFTRVYASSRESGEREAEDRLKLFDTMITRAERDSFENGRRALLVLAKRHATSTRMASTGMASATAEALVAEARELGISEIYFVDSAGKVVATSFKPDQGLALFSLGREFARFLAKVYGSGESTDQALSQSSLTGTINSYQYFSPKGSDYLIEISTRLDDAIGRNYPGLDYTGLVALAFGSLSGDEGSRPLARIVDLIAVRGISTWSLFEKRIDQSRYAGLVAASMMGKSAENRGRYSTILVKPIKLAEGAPAEGDTTYYAVFEIDLRPLLQFRLFALLSVLASCGLATGISYAAMKRSFDRNVAARIDLLQAGIARAAGGKYEPETEDYGPDEIGDIGRKVDSMVRTILEKEERLRVAQRMETIGAMASGLAHDFNNILTGISGTIECIELRLEAGDSSPEELLDLTGLASRTAKKGGELVRSLIDVASTHSPERRPVDLSVLARESAELARGGAGGSTGGGAGGGARERIVIRVEAPDEPLIVECDAQAVLRAAFNLCINGIQAMTSMRSEGERRGGTLLVRVETRPGKEGRRAEAAIVVKDEGVGIAPEDMGKVLMPFYTTKPRGLGTGIGLAIALSVAEGHGGRLEMESSAGSGSTFAIVLPA